MPSRPLNRPYPTVRLRAMVRQPGTAYRVLADTPDYLSMTELMGMAIEVAGQDNHFRYIQLPYNLFMPEAFAFTNQQVSEDFLSPIAALRNLASR